MLRTGRNDRITSSSFKFLGSNHVTEKPHMRSESSSVTRNSTLTERKTKTILALRFKRSLGCNLQCSRAQQKIGNDISTFFFEGHWCLREKKPRPQQPLNVTVGDKHMISSTFVLLKVCQMCRTLSEISETANMHRKQIQPKRTADNETQGEEKVAPYRAFYF